MHTVPEILPYLGSEMPQFIFRCDMFTKIGITVVNIWRSEALEL